MKNKLRSSDVPELTLERYLLGELPSKDMASIKEAIVQDRDLKRRLDQMIQSNQDILEKHPPETIGHFIRARAGEGMPKRIMSYPRWMTPVLTGSLVILILHFLPDILLDRNLVNDSRLISSDQRIKGLEPSLRLFRKTEAGSEVLNDHGKVTEGDLIRLGYQAADALYGAIISVDGRGTVTQHLPRSGDLSSPLKMGEVILLDYSYELDDAPNWERFYFITSQTPFRLGPILEAANQLDTTTPASSQESLRIKTDLKQFLITLQKVTQ